MNQTKKSLKSFAIPVMNYFMELLFPLIESQGEQKITVLPNKEAAVFVYGKVQSTFISLRLAHRSRTKATVPELSGLHSTSKCN